MKTRNVLNVVSLASAMLLVSCSSDESSTDTSKVETTSSTQTGSEVVVENAWARTSPMDAEMGAAYLVITSPVDDAVVKADVDVSIATMTQIHETTMNDDGTMGMQEIDEIVLPAGEKVSLKPGGYHVMLMGLKQPLETGSTLMITLTLKSGSKLTVEAKVRESTGM